MNPWDILGWLFVVIVGFIVLGVVIILILFVVAAFIGISDARLKKKVTNIYTSPSDKVDSEEIYRNTKKAMGNGLQP